MLDPFNAITLILLQRHFTKSECLYHSWSQQVHMYNGPSDIASWNWDIKKPMFLLEVIWKFSLPAFVSAFWSSNLFDALHCFKYKLCFPYFPLMPNGCSIWFHVYWSLCFFLIDHFWVPPSLSFKVSLSTKIFVLVISSDFNMNENWYS